MTQILTMNRDMRPWQANHDYTLPDAAADILIKDGTARPAILAVGDGVMLKPDAEPVKPRNRFLTRGRGR